MEGAKNSFAAVETSVTKREKLHNECRARAEMTLDHLQNRRRRRRPGHSKAQPPRITPNPTAGPRNTAKNPNPIHLEPLFHDVVTASGNRNFIPAPCANRAVPCLSRLSRKYLSGRDTIGLRKAPPRARKKYDGLGGRLAVAVALACFFQRTGRRRQPKAVLGHRRFYDHDYSAKPPRGERYDPNKFTPRTALCPSAHDYAFQRTNASQRGCHHQRSRAFHRGPRP